MGEYKYIDQKVGRYGEEGKGVLSGRKGKRGTCR